jgi:hypothetical protein
LSSPAPAASAALGPGRQPTMAGKTSELRPASSAEAIRRWRRLVKTLQEGKHPDPQLVQWLADATAAYEEAAPYGNTLDQTLGLAPSPGHLGWWSAEPLEQRDRLLRELRRKYFADLTITAAARAIAREGKEIESRGLHHGTPGSAVNERRKMFVSLVKSGASLPGARRLETILRNEP